MQNRIEINKIDNDISLAILNHQKKDFILGQLNSYLVSESRWSVLFIDLCKNHKPLLLSLLNHPKVEKSVELLSIIFPYLLDQDEQIKKMGLDILLKSIKDKESNPLMEGLVQILGAGLYAVLDNMAWTFIAVRILLKNTRLTPKLKNVLNVFYYQEIGSRHHEFLFYCHTIAGFWGNLSVQEKDYFDEMTLQMIDKMHREEWITVSNYLVKFPYLTEQYLPLLSRHKSITMKDGGISLDTYSQLARSSLKKLDEHSIPSVALFVKKVNAMDCANEPLTQSLLIDSLPPKGYQFERFQGRSILFSPIDDSEKKWIAIKVRKKDEQKAELLKQYNIEVELNHIKKSGTPLHSELPTPLFCGEKPGVLSYLQNFYENVAEENKQIFYKQFLLFRESIATSDHDHLDVYIYEADKEYFTYLPLVKLPPQKMQEKCQTAVHDLFILLMNAGLIYHQLGSAWHDEKSGSIREEGGRYHALVDLTRNLALNTLGNGSLENWLGAIAYLNIRLCGLADLGDFITTDDIKYFEHPFLKRFFNELGTYAKKNNKETLGSLHLLANFIAEYMLILELTLGCYARSQDVNSLETGFAGLSDILCAIYSEAFAILADISFEEARTFLEKAIDFNHYHEQMKYWMTNKYIKDLNEGRIPIYKPEVAVHFKGIYEFNGRSWLYHKGFSFNGIHQDLGHGNGPYPIKAGDEARYLLATFSLLTKEGSRLADKIPAKPAEICSLEETKRNLRAAGRACELGMFSAKACENFKQAFEHWQTAYRQSKPSAK